MFPETDNTLTTQQPVTASNGISFKFDFNSGDFILIDGRVAQCTGNEALKVWIEKILRTEKERYAIYEDTNYGIVLEDLIVGNTYSIEFIESELKREIEDALMQNPQIKGISSFLAERVDQSLIITLTIETTSKETLTQEVTLGV